jgi:hypothetical protein
MLRLAAKLVRRLRCLVILLILTFKMWVEQQTGRPGFDPRQRQGIFPLASVSRPALGAHPAACQVGTGGPFPGVKRGQGVTLTTPSSSAEVKNEWDV